MFLLIINSFLDYKIHAHGRVQKIKKSSVTLLPRNKYCGFFNVIISFWDLFLSTYIYTYECVWDHTANTIL